MIPVEYYSLVYYIVLSIFVFLFGYLRLCVSNNVELDNKYINNILSLLLLLVVIFFIGLRDPYGSFMYLGDTRAYTRAYEQIASTNLFETKDIGFSLVMSIIFYLGAPIQLFYVICAFLYVIPPYFAFKRWFQENAFYALLMYVTAMSFWAFGINGLRNGLAASIFIFALAFVDKKWLMLLLMFLSVSFHKSMLLLVLMCFIAWFVRNTKYLIIAWICCALVSIFVGPGIEGYLIPYLSKLEDTRVAIYQEESLMVFANKSFRIDFFLYSSLPIWVGWYYTYKKRYKDAFYTLLLNTYILANSVWILFFMYVPFTDRYAYLSWLLMPILLLYPLLKESMIENRYRTIGAMITLNLLFTLIIFFK